MAMPVRTCGCSSPPSIISARRSVSEGLFVSISGLDLNLVQQAGPGRRGLVVIVTPDTICEKPSMTAAVHNCPWRPLWLSRDFWPMEGDPSRSSGAAEKTDYGRSRLAEPVGARIDLLC